MDCDENHGRTVHTSFVNPDSGNSISTPTFRQDILKPLLQMTEQCDPVPEPEPTTTPPPPPQPCVLSDWEEWSGCSATCGGGKRGRVKVVRTEPACGGEPCSGDIHDIGDCNEEACESEFKSIISHYQHNIFKLVNCFYLQNCSLCGKCS